MAENPFLIAAQNNDLDELNNQLKQGIDINSLSDDGWSALHFAAFRGYDQIVEFLLKAKINVNIQGKVYHRTALHYAVDRANLQSVKLLIEGGADTKIKDIAGKTALDIAQDKGFSEIVKILTTARQC